MLQRVERDRIAAAAEAKRQNLMRKELAWLRRGAPARTSNPNSRIDAANQLIADVPPLRNTVELAKLATARLGKDVIDLLDVSVSYPEPPMAGRYFAMSNGGSAPGAHRHRRGQRRQEVDPAGAHRRHHRPRQWPGQAR